VTWKLEGTRPDPTPQMVCCIRAFEGGAISPSSVSSYLSLASVALVTLKYIPLFSKTLIFAFTGGGAARAGDGTAVFPQRSRLFLLNLRRKESSVHIIRAHLQSESATTSERSKRDKRLAVQVHSIRYFNYRCYCSLKICLIFKKLRNIIIV
jgi:hypothetical protein